MKRELFQLPDLAPTQQIIKRKAGTPDISTLLPRQKDVFDGMIEFLTSEGGGIAVLEGVAGAGKTYIVSRIIEQYLMLKPVAKVAFASTTNASLEVSYKSTEFNHPMLSFSTIHRLLALKETMLADGSMDFYPDKFVKPSITEFAFVAVDECSQFSRKLWSFLEPYTNLGIKILLIGDRFQTPAVKDGDESVVFTAAWQRQANALSFKLTDIVRQAADSPIISVATYVRENINRPVRLHNHFGTDMLRGDKGAYFLDKDEDGDYFDALLAHLYKSPNFLADGRFVKCVTWRRKVVAKLNKNIRRIIYGKGKLRRIEPNEKIISAGPIFDESQDAILISTGKQMEVIEFSRRQEEINAGQFVIPFYDTKVRYYDMYGTPVIRRINIPTDLGVIAYNEVCNILAEAAKSHKQGTFAFKNAWGEFYRFQKSFAAIQHSYAGTVHTCQGETVSNVIALAFDIQCNPRLVEQNKILYTAVTRASDRVFIL